MTFDAAARRHVQELFETLADRLVNDLSNAAREEAEAAAARARHDSEQAAAAELATARAEGEARLAAELATARAESEARLAAELATARAEGEARLAAAQAMNAGLLESVEAARGEVAAVKEAAEADIARARQAAQADVDRAQQAAQADSGRIRQELEGEVERLHQERAKILLARDEAATRLDAETRKANELAARLEGAGRDRAGVFDRIAAAFRSIDGATTPAEILETLLGPLGDDFARAAVFMVGPSSLKGWRARGLDPTIDITKLVIPHASESLLARAAAERKRLIASADGTPVIGLSGNPVPRAVALPVLAGDHVIAVAYAEDLEDSASAALSVPRVGCQIAEMLIDHAALRLTAKGSTMARPAPSTASIPPSAPAYTPVRQAERLKPQQGVDLTVDGTASSLVDVSGVGAQFLSPQAMRPNRVLRLILRAGDQSLPCKARVMWARFEQAHGADAAHYRVGVKFTDVDAKTVEAFLAGHQASTAATTR